MFRSGYVEISDRNKTFSQRKRSGQPAVSDPVQLIHPCVKPVEGEVVVGKHRVNALYGTDLDMTLRGNDIHTLIILGYATSGVVLSTVRHAADLDYQLAGCGRRGSAAELGVVGRLLGEVRVGRWPIEG